MLGLPVTSVSGAEPWATVPIYVATTRARSDNLSLPYSAERPKTLSFAKLDIGIPQNHVPGRVEEAGVSLIPAGTFRHGRTNRSLSGKNSSDS